MSPSVSIPDAFSSGAFAYTYRGYGQAFRSTELNALIEEATANNPDFQVLHAQVLQKLRSANGFRAQALPTSTLSLNDTFRLANSGGALSASLTLSFNPMLDIWGATAASIQSGVLSNNASVLDLRTAHLNLEMAVVKSWSGLILSRRVLSLRRNAEASYKSIQSASEDAVRSGRGSAAAVQSSLSDFVSARATTEQQRQIVREAEQALKRLLGRNIGDGMYLATSTLSRFPEAPQTGTPAEVLSRRPDIQAAWLRVQAAEQSFQATRRGVLPNVSLTGNTGQSSNSLQGVLALDQLVVSIIASVSTKLLDQGKQLRDVEAAVANAEISLLNYSSTVLDALLEVDQLLSRELSLKRRIALQKQSSGISREQLDRNIESLRNGAVSTSVVTANAVRLYDAEIQILNLRSQILTNRLALYVSLGDSYFLESE
ncbi:MAG: TolC family protein [Rhodobacteraceae bacterium]|nr:TolC family protein [Paracoccaceae bacterium]